VFPTEPVPEDSPFWATPNLIMTPHCSVDDHSVYMDRCLHLFADNLNRYIAGKPMRNVVDPALGY
jgi:phosphoglycerate dehydrogenase-like enzyme